MRAISLTMFLLTMLLSGCIADPAPAPAPALSAADQFLPVDDDGGEEPCGYDEGCGSPGDPGTEIPVTQCYSPMTWVPDCMWVHGIPYNGSPGSECLSAQTWHSGCANDQPVCAFVRSVRPDGKTQTTWCCGTDPADPQCWIEID